MNHSESQPNRRKFLATSLAAGAGVALTSGSISQSVQAEEKGHHRHYQSLIKPGATILFQGDSITDAGRDKSEKGQAAPNMQPGMGKGYAWMAAASMLVGKHGKDLTIYNRGISGHKVPNLAARWKKDCIDIKPDVLSILIGVNDIWHWINGKYDGSVEKYETGYRELLQQTRESLPDTKLVICEPFVLKCGAVNGKWFPTFDGYREVAKKLAEEQKAVFVPFQSMFDKAIEYAPANHWAGDGVHPTANGAALMASAWVKAVSHVAS